MSDTESWLGPVRMVFEAGELRGVCRSAVITYHLGERSWSQKFEAEDVSDEVLAADAADVDFAVGRMLDDTGSWVELVAV